MHTKNALTDIFNKYSICEYKVKKYLYLSFFTRHALILVFDISEVYKEMAKGSKAEFSMDEVRF